MVSVSTDPTLDMIHEWLEYVLCNRSYDVGSLFAELALHAACRFHSSGLAERGFCYVLMDIYSGVRQGSDWHPSHAVVVAWGTFRFPQSCPGWHVCDCGGHFICTTSWDGKQPTTESALCIEECITLKDGEGCSRIVHGKCQQCAWMVQCATFCETSDL